MNQKVLDKIRKWVLLTDFTTIYADSSYPDNNEPTETLRHFINDFFDSDYQKFVDFLLQKKVFSLVELLNRPHTPFFYRAFSLLYKKNKNLAVRFFVKKIMSSNITYNNNNNKYILTLDSLDEVQNFYPSDDKEMVSRIMGEDYLELFYINWGGITDYDVEEFIDCLTNERKNLFNQLLEKKYTKEEINKTSYYELINGSDFRDAFIHRFNDIYNASAESELSTKIIKDLNIDFKSSGLGWVYNKDKSDVIGFNVDVTEIIGVIVQKFVTRINDRKQMNKLADVYGYYSESFFVFYDELYPKNNKPELPDLSNYYPDLACDIVNDYFELFYDEANEAQ